MNSSEKLLLLFQKENEHHVICIKHAFIDMDSDGYYTLGAEETFEFLPILGKEWTNLESWIIRDDNYFFEFQNYIAYIFSQNSIEHITSLFDFSWNVQKHIMYQTSFEKEKLNHSSQDALLLLNSKAKTILKPKIEQKDIQKKTDLPPISNTVSDIQKNIIGQNEAIRKTVYAIYSNLNLMQKNLTLSEIITLKNNVLLSGPSGSGKTEIARQLSEKLNLPVIIEDIKHYSGTGWKGNEIIDILRKIYLKSGKNIQIAERCILFLDEIDKIAITENSHPHNTLEVQQGLLKLMEGGIYTLDLSSSNEVPFDTKYLTIICAGAFNAYNRKNIISSNNSILTKMDYINYGLMPEFVGRIKTFLTLKKLTLEEQKQFLTESNLSALQLELKEFKKNGISIHLNCSMEKLCEKIIEKANTISNNECGLRDMNQIATEIFSEIHYLEYDNIPFDQVTFDVDILENPRSFTLQKTKS